MMKKGANYGIAAMIFVITLILINGAAIALSIGTAVIGIIIGGGTGVDMAYDFLTNHLNLYSCMIYVIPGIVFLLWYFFAFIEPVGVSRFTDRETRRLSPACFIWMAVLAFAIQHTLSLLMGLIAVMMPSAMENYAELMESSGVTQYSTVWVIATLVLPPLVEETIFRGLIMQYLRRGGASFIVANLIQAVLFGFFHMNIVQGIYTAIFGFLLGYLAWRYDSLLAPMAMHALFNFFGTAVVDLENAVLPDFMLGLIIMVSVPITVIVIVMIHFGIADKKWGRS